MLILCDYLQEVYFSGKIKMDEEISSLLHWKHSHRIMSKHGSVDEILEWHISPVLATVPYWKAPYPTAQSLGEV